MYIACTCPYTVCRCAELARTNSTWTITISNSAGFFVDDLKLEEIEPAAAAANESYLRRLALERVRPTPAAGRPQIVVQPMLRIKRPPGRFAYYQGAF